MSHFRPAELVLILVIVLLLFGSKKLPELAKSISQSLKVIRDETGLSETDKEEDQSRPPEQKSTSSNAPASEANCNDPA